MLKIFAPRALHSHHVNRFYEWQKIKGPQRKQPYFITQEDNKKKKEEEKAMFFAAVYTVLTGVDGMPSECFTIITVPAHKSIEHIHVCYREIYIYEASVNFSFVQDRMPAVIDAELLDVWLGGDDELALSLLTPQALHYHAVSPYVSAFGNDGPECIKPVDVKQLLPGQKSISGWVAKREPSLKVLQSIICSYTDRR